MLMKNRVLSELVSDHLLHVSDLHDHRAAIGQIHLGHHEYTNDWERDPEILNVAETRRMADFPMTPVEVFKNFALHSALAADPCRPSTWDMIYVNALGNGVHPYEMDDAPARRPGKTIRNFRPATVLGLAYVVVMALVIGGVGLTGPTWLLAVTPVVLWSAACVVVWRLPDSYFFQSKLKPVYSGRITSMLRLGSLTLLQTVLSVSYYMTGTNYAIYFWLLWVVPLGTSFPYLMLLRDLVQHANADDGKLTNSRVVFCHPFIRWAMFVYGQDAHLTHHLYPAVPHYNLPRLHQLLKEENVEYAQHVVECHGLVWPGKPAAADGHRSLARPTREPLDEEATENLAANDAVSI